MSRVLVTGGAGYIGSHAVKALLASGHEVVVYDNLSAGHRAAVRAIASGNPTGGMTLVEGDVRDTARLATALRDSKAEAVMHFAAWLSVGDSVKDPIGYYDNNVRGTLSVLQAMVESGVGTSSSPPLRPRSGTRFARPSPKTIHSRRSTRTAPRS